jgi:hypothetical protein
MKSPDKLRSVGHLPPIEAHQNVPAPLGDFDNWNSMLVNWFWGVNGRTGETRVASCHPLPQKEGTRALMRHSNASLGFSSVL